MSSSASSTLILGRCSVINPELTKRELEVLSIVGRGFSYRYAGEVLHISKKTVERHITRIYGKLHMTTRDELIEHCIAEGLVGESPSCRKCAIL